MDRALIIVIGIITLSACRLSNTINIDLTPFIDYTDYDESYFSKAEYFGLIGQRDSAFHYLSLSEDSHSKTILSNANFASLTDDIRWEKLVDDIAVKNNISQIERYKAEWNINDGAYIPVIKSIGKSVMSKEEKEELLDSFWSRNKVHRRKNVAILEKLADINTGYEDLGATLFMTLQHIGDLETMSKYKPVMEDCLNRQIISPYQYAYFIDRYKMLSDEKQIYGTQIKKDDSGQFYLYPVENKVILDSLRKSAGIEISVEDYIETIKNMN